MILNPKNLAGKLGEVYINGELDKSLVGSYEGKKVIIAGSPSNIGIGRSCLVRFDYQPRTNFRDLFSNFVSIKIPKGIQNLANNNYILYTEWGQDMSYSGVFPNRNELNKYFNMRDLGPILFIWDDPEKNSAVRTTHNVFRNDQSLTLDNALNIIRSYLGYSIPAIINANSDHKESIFRIIRKRELWLVRMDRVDLKF